VGVRKSVTAKANVIAEGTPVPGYWIVNVMSQVLVPLLLTLEPRVE
jgi:hypothetical protein